MQRPNWAIRLKACLLVIRDVKNMPQENRESTCMLSSPHSRLYCCIYTFLCALTRETVSPHLQGFDCLIQHSWTGFWSLIDSFMLMPACVFSSSHRVLCVFDEFLYSYCKYLAIHPQPTFSLSPLKTILMDLCHCKVFFLSCICQLLICV